MIKLVTLSPAFLYALSVDAIGSSAYEAQYDASGNMTCRTPTGPQVCTSGSQTGARLTYDAEERLIQWVSADGLTTVNYGYDGEGNRFEMQVTSGSTTVTTSYISNLEEVQTVSGGATTKIVYFSLAGQRVAEDDNTHWYYPLNDALTSTTVVIDFSGVIAAQLFGPYGQARWAGGSMPTTFAFTGQRADATTGLDYYGARYYDPAAGTFISADSVLGKGAGLNRYAYVAGNPETLTDPTGHYRSCAGCGGSGSGGSGGNPPPTCPPGVGSCTGDGGSGPPVPVPPNPPDPNPDPQPPVPWQPGFDDARSAALAASIKFGLAFTAYLGALATLAGILALLNNPPAWLRVIDAFLSTKLGIGILAILTTTLLLLVRQVVLVATEAFALAAAFGWQSTWDNELWTNPLLLGGFFYVVHLSLDILSNRLANLRHSLDNLKPVAVPDSIWRVISKGLGLGSLLTGWTNDKLFKGWVDKAQHDEICSIYWAYC